jgi:hypothetical protein
MQANPNDKVHLVLADVLMNLHVPLVSTFPLEIHVWNMRVDNYIISIFDFVEKFLAIDGMVLFLNLYDLCVIKEIEFYL